MRQSVMIPSDLFIPRNCYIILGISFFLIKRHLTEIFHEFYYLLYIERNHICVLFIYLNNDILKLLYCHINTRLLSVKKSDLKIRVCIRNCISDIPSRCGLF